MTDVRRTTTSDGARRAVVPDLVPLHQFQTREVPCLSCGSLPCEGCVKDVEALNNRPRGEGLGCASSPAAAAIRRRTLAFLARMNTWDGMRNEARKENESHRRISTPSRPIPKA